MTDQRPAPVATMRPRPDKLEARVRELAQNSRNVAWGIHARERMAERDITDQMMFEVLRTGTLRGEVSAGGNPGEWCCKLVKQMKGRREVGVVTMVVRDQRLFVKTVEWEDVR
ncbi:DUF4258 domain-containing protein [Xanthobacter sediminis]